MSYILEVQEDEDGELYIIFPNELIEELNWHEGDILNWDLKGNGAVLSKLNDPSGYEIVEK